MTQAEHIECQICGSLIAIIDAKELKIVYRIFKNSPYVCVSCANRLDKIVNYYGEKSQKDKDLVRSIIADGKLYFETYSKLVNAGYF